MSHVEIVRDGETAVVAQLIQEREADSIREFVEIWYADSTREQLRAIRTCS